MPVTTECIQPSGGVRISPVWPFVALIAGIGCVWVVFGPPHFKAHSHFAVIGLGFIFIYHIAIGLVGTARENTPRGPLVPLQFEDTYGSTAEKILSSADMTWHDLLVAPSDNCFAFASAPDQLNRPVFGSIVANLLTSVELAVLAVRWRIEHRSSIILGLIVCFLLGSILGGWLILPRGLRDLGAVGVLLAGATTVWLSKRELLFGGRLTRRLLHLSVPAPTMVSAATKLEFIKSHPLKPTSPVPSRVDSRELEFREKAYARAMHKHRTKIIELHGQFRRQIRTIGRVAGMSDDELREIVGEAVTCCERTTAIE